MDRPTFPPKFSKVLVTPDPQYIPGYAGYCPQLKYNMGQSYGQMTHKLLTNPEGRGSSRWVLSNGRLQSPEPPDRTVCRPDRAACRLDRTGDPPERTVYGPDWTADGTDRTTGGPDGITDGMDWSGHAMRRTPPLHQGERRNLDTMIPGYTGFVPKRQKYYAQTYSQTCRGAFTEFNRDQNTRRHLQPLHPPVVSYRSPEFKVRKLNTPLNTVSHGPTPPKDPEAWEALGSPYLMDDQSPHKYFISGFTGYVPKSRFLIGRGYPATTNEALIQFGGEMQHDFSRSADGMRRKGSALPPVQTIYPSSQGLLPFYTGHVPGYKYMYGDTFGKLTHNALGMSGAKRSIGVKL